MVSIQLDRVRKLQFFPQHGGFEQLRFIDGIGWCLAQDEDWPDAPDIIARCQSILQNFITAS